MQYLPNPIQKLKLKLNISSSTQYLLLYSFYRVVGFDIKSLFLVPRYFTYCRVKHVFILFSFIIKEIS